MQKNIGRKKKLRIKYKCIIFFFVILVIISLPIFYASSLKIKNIYVIGNTRLTDQEIIDIANLGDYPKVTDIKTKELVQQLEDNVYIKDVKVKFKNLRREIDLYVEENKPLLFYQYDETYLLSDGQSVKDSFNVPILINQTPDKILIKLLSNLNELDDDILQRISEIRYYPSDVDEELFFLTMNDGNYIYINFNNFDKLKKYREFVKSFNNKKGIIHLDSGDYLELFK